MRPIFLNRTRSRRARYRQYVLDFLLAGLIVTLMFFTIGYAFPESFN
jgi:hypothetical protein